jgi:hypothetical protein
MASISAQVFVAAFATSMALLAPPTDLVEQGLSSLAIPAWISIVLLTIFFLLSSALAIAYPLLFAEIYGRI